MPIKEKARQDAEPIPNCVFADPESITSSLLTLQASRLVRLYAVNAAMAETIAPLVFLEAMLLTTSAVNQACPIKRIRATKAEVEDRREALLDIIEDGQPMTVRQVFYQATVRGLVEKTEAGYGKVQTDLAGDAPGRRAALRLARRQHPLAAQAADLRQRRGGARGDRQVLSQGAVGRRRLLRRDLAGEGRACRRRLPGHRACTTCR